MKKIIVALSLIAGVVFGGVNEEAAIIIKTFEGEALLTAKADVGDGTPIIGYSCQVRRAEALGYVGSITLTESENLLSQCIQQEASYMEKVPGYLSSPLMVRVVSISAAYNNHKFIGPNYKRFLAARDYDRLSRELAWGVSSSNKFGIINRRFAEANLIRGELGLELLDTPADMAEFIKLKKANYPIK